MLQISCRAITEKYEVLPHQGGPSGHQNGPVDLGHCEKTKRNTQFYLVLIFGLSQHIHSSGYHYKYHFRNQIFLKISFLIILYLTQT